MALTRPRAYQIYDIDYKQAVRVVTISNVTLAGGAPNSVDGVNLSLNDRVLVTGQTSGVQNGIYYVTTLGSGSNGTWTRSIDTDQTGELLSGTIVMVTEGVAYADTQWKLTTNDPITIGVSSLTFVQNYLANSISFGQTSFAVGSANANATVSVSGTGNVVVWAPTGEYVTGLVSASGNITGGNLTTGGQVTSTGNITGGNVLTGGIVSATGNVQGGNLVLTNGSLSLGNVNTFTSNSAIQGWSYSGVSLSISASEGTSTGLFFGNVGNSFYLVGTTNSRVYQYNMSTTNMANTGTVFGNVLVSGTSAAPADLFFNSTGANMYVLGQTARTVSQYTLSTPWNITTAASASLSANISAQEATPTGLWFSSDMANMYVVGSTNNTVYQYTLTTPGNVATATYASKSVSVNTATNGGTQAVNLSSDGTKMWAMGSTTPAVAELNLATPYDVSTATYALGNTFGILAQEGTSTGMFVDVPNARAWITGQANDTVYQYNTANSIILQANAVGIQGQLAVSGNTWFGQQVQFGGALRAETTLTVDSTLTGGAGVTFSTTTSAISIGTSQTTGTTTIGGTAQTGNIAIGRSTASQGIVIGNGVTASGSTKTIDIGTLGAANSTTNINIGPTAGNATVAFLSNAQVSIANTGGAALSVVGNTTSGNLLTGGLISSTGNITSAANIAGGNVLATTIVSAASLLGSIVSVSANITGGNLLTGGLISATSNITSAANISGGNILTGGLISATGNITGNYILGNGSQLTGLPATYANANVAAYLASGTDSSNIITTANVSGGNVLATTIVSGSSVLGSIVSASANITGGNILTGGLISVTGNITGGNILGNGRNLTGINAFSTISVTGQSNVVANTISSPLTFAAGTGISITTDSTNAIVTVTAATTTSIFATGGSMGLVTESVTQSQDLGNVADAVSGTTYDLGVIAVDGVVLNNNIAPYQITGDKLANNFTYTSNLSVTGNIVESGGNIYTGGVIVPNQDQVVAYIFAF